MADVDKVKRRLGLAEAGGKVPQVGEGVLVPLATQGPGQAGEVHEDLCHDVDVARALVAVLGDGRTKSLGCPLAAIDALLHPALAELPHAGVNGPRRKEREVVDVQSCCRRR